MAPLDYGPVLLRMPFGFRLAADTLPSGCPCGQNPTVGASPWLYPSFPTSCPFRVRHGRVPQPTRRYPRLWIRRPSSGRPRDLNPPDQNTAQHTLRDAPTPCPSISPHFVSFAWRYHRCVPCSFPSAADARPWVILELVCRFSEPACHDGDGRVSQVPGEPSCDHSPCSPTPAGPGTPWVHVRRCRRGPRV